MLVGEAALDRIKELSVAGTDASASSHWRDRLSGYHLEGGRPAGYRGFGLVTPRTLVRDAGHFIMQMPYRLLGRQFKDYTHFRNVARRLVGRQNRALDHDVMRHIFTAACCSPWFDKMPKESWHLVIGDGNGTMASMLYHGVPGSRIALTNLTPVLLVDLIESARGGIPLDQIAFAESEEAVNQAMANPGIRILAVTADQQTLLRGKNIGFVYNTASMGEMNPDTVASYFDTMRSFPERPFFYNANRDEKVLPDGTASRFAEYPWRTDDEIFFSGRAFWYYAFYTYMPPRYYKFSGLSTHRLARMALAN